ncbi:MAG: dihydroorotate dehydrogenase electron transfer subunit [Lachnospiraceae bacterium]|nr:dihydroorotate dehydrogenase electron transfer subunit [Lachnospiraceae bacterium]
MLFPDSPAYLLGRPVSICEALPEKEELRFIFRRVGFGTAAFSRLSPGTELFLTGPLGNGFPLKEARGKVFILGGGIGIPPLFGLGKELKKDDSLSLNFILGYRSKAEGLFLSEDFSSLGDCRLTTDDGSEGFPGTVTDCIRSLDIIPDIIFSCGPLPMLRAVKQYAAEHGVKAYLSLEEKMACGVGACLGCVVKTTGTDPHSGVHNARVCAEGPVFDSEMVVL